MRTWSAVNQALSAEPVSDRVNIRVGTAPSQAREAIDSLRRLAEQPSLPLSLCADLGTGLIYAAVDGPGVAIETLNAFWERAREIGTHATILSAPFAVKAGTDVFGNPPAGFAVMRALKRQFDPLGILNRGRFVGHL